MVKYLLIICLLFTSVTSNSQVLITLLLGDKLNSPNLEFGLEGGFNWAQISGMETTNWARRWNLGFYFDFRIKDNWWLNTGVLVKSNLGVDNLTDGDLEFLNANIHRSDTAPDYRIPGDYSQKMNIFLVPAMIKYKFEKRIFVAAGFQFGLIYKAFIDFEADVDGFETSIKEINTDDMNRIDAGGMALIGYQFRKTPGISLGVKYYEGFVNVYKGVSGRRNRSFFIYATIPIGRGKAAEKREQKQKEQETGTGSSS
jgi:hypothetical protein